MQLMTSHPQQVYEADIIREEQKNPYELLINRNLALQAPMFAVKDGILYYVATKGSVRRVVHPRHLLQQSMEESHGRYAAHFCGPEVNSRLAKHSWWEGM